MNNSNLFDLIKNHEKLTTDLWKEVDRRKISWKTLATNGFKVRAMKAYKDVQHCTLTDAKEAVEAFLSEKGYNVY
jgi:ribosomal protein L7/L12